MQWLKRREKRKRGSQKAHETLFDESLIESKGTRGSRNRWIALPLSLLLHVSVIAFIIINSYLALTEAVQQPTIPIAFFFDPIPENPPPPPLERKDTPRLPPLRKRETEQKAPGQSESDKDASAGQLKNEMSELKLPLFETAREAQTRDKVTAKTKEEHPADLFAQDLPDSEEDDAGAPEPVTGMSRIDQVLQGHGKGNKSPQGGKSSQSRIPVTRKDLLEGPSMNPPLSGTGEGGGAQLSFDTGFSPNLSFETKDFNWSDYGMVIYWAIWRSWHNRLYLTLDNFERWSIENHSPSINGVTSVTFVIEKNGNISDITLLYSSSIEPLDVSAVDALKEAIIPPLPVNFSKKRERVTARFIAETDIASMKFQLARMKYYGQF